MGKTSVNELRVLRARKRINQYDTALKAKISPNRYWRIENGYTQPTPDEREALARLFRVPVTDAFPGVMA